MRQLADTLQSSVIIPNGLALHQVEVSEQNGSILFDSYIYIDETPVGRFSSVADDGDGSDSNLVHFIDEASSRRALNLVSHQMIDSLQHCPWANPNGSTGKVRLSAFTHALHAILEPHILQILLPMTERFIIKQSGYCDFYYLSFNDETPFDKTLTEGSSQEQQNARELFTNHYVSFINSMERHERILNDPAPLRVLRLACIEPVNHRRWEGTFRN